MLQRSNKKRTAPAAGGSASTPNVQPGMTVLSRDTYVTISSEVERLGALVKQARSKLGPLARAKTMFQRGSAVTDLGDIDGAHIVLLVSKVDIDGDGTVGGDEFARFLGEAADLISSVQSSVLNTSIVAALMLTIVIPILIEPFDGFSEPSSEDLLGTVFADAAGFFTGGGASGAEAAMRARKGLYVAECVLLGLTSCCCFTGIFVSVAYYGCIASMPGPVATVSFLLDNCGALSRLQVLWSQSLLLLILSMPLVAARASAVAFVCALVASVGAVTFTQMIMLSCWRSQLAIFHEEARALVGGDGAEEDEAHEGSTGAPPQPPMLAGADSSEGGKLRQADASGEDA